MFVSGRLNLSAYMSRESIPTASAHIHASDIQFLSTPNRAPEPGQYQPTTAVTPPYQTTEPTWDPEDIFAEPQGAAV